MQKCQQFQNQRTSPPQQQGRNPQVQARQGQKPQLNPQQRQKILEKFDRDGDGQLSEKERNAAKKAWKKQNRKPKADAPAKPEPSVE